MMTEASSNAEKVRENRLRRMVKAQGYALVKSRARYERALDFGCYMIIDPFINGVVAGVGPTGRPDFSLDEVEDWLAEDKAVEAKAQTE